jgi:integrase
MLTDIAIRKIKPSDKRQEIPEGRIGGLLLVVQPLPSGSKSWALRFRLLGATAKLTFGPYPAISLGEARSMALQALGQIAKGIDPRAQKKTARAAARAERDAVTFAGLIDDWSSLHLAEKRASYAREAVRALRHAFEKHLTAPAAALERVDVVRVLDGITKAGKKAIVRATAAYGRACYSWAIKRGALTVNPFMNLPVAPVAKRDRGLTDQELGAVWGATEAPGPFNAIVRMAMLTGQRRSEIAGMTWAELADDLSTWTIPASRTKNAAAHIVPLSQEAQAIVKRAPRIEGKGDLVFPGQRGVFAGWSSAKDHLDAASGVTRWRLHDLRRTVATNLQKLGVRLEVTESILNHVSGSRSGIVGIYQKYTWDDEKRLALDAWSRRLAAIVGGEDEAATVVVAFQRK